MRSYLMNKEQLEKARQELLLRKRKIEEVLQLSMKDKENEKGNSKDDGDLAVDSTIEALTSSFHSTEANEYKMILEALKAIETGAYGICKDCGDHIAQRRLDYYPNAQRCLACQEAFEMNE